MTGNGDQNHVSVARIDGNLRNLLAVAQTKMRPGLSRVGGFVNAVAYGQIGTLQSFATADIDDVWIGWRYRNAPDRAGRLIVENRIPRAAIVIRLPNSTVHLRHIENTRLRRNARQCTHATSTAWADAAPVKRAKEFRIELLRNRHRGNSDYR